MFPPKAPYPVLTNSVGPRTDRSSIPALTAVRFFPAFLVLMMHAAHPSNPLGMLLLRSRAATNFVHTGYAGVGFFFVLSGFVLTISYDQYLDLRLYLTARLARIYPMYLIGMVMVAPFVIASATHTARINGGRLAAFDATVGGALSAFLVQAWVPRWALTWNSPAWSLSAEAFFYLIFPAVLRLSQDSNRRLFFAVLGIWGVVQAAILVAYCVHSLPAIAHASASSPPESSQLGNFLKFNPILRLPEFLFGVVVGQLHLRRVPEHWMQGSAPVLISAGLSISFAAFLSPHLPFLFFHNGGLAPLFAFLIYSLAVSRGRLIRYLFESRALVLLGRSSYITYILQVPVLGWLALIDGKTLRIAQWSPIGFVVAQFVILLSGSILLQKWIEEPARKAIHSWLNRTSSPVRSHSSHPE